MAYYYDKTSHTFSEYLLVPGYSSENSIPSNVSLDTPLVRFNKGETPSIKLHIPMVSAIMQSVSGEKMGQALAREGGCSFIFSSQSIENECSIVSKVKAFKAGFVPSASNIEPDKTLKDIVELQDRLGFSTIAVTSDGSPEGKLLGVVTRRDWRISKMDLQTKVKDFMTPFPKIVYGEEGISLSEANDLLWEHKLNSLPIIDEEEHLKFFVFRKDYDSHKENPYELLDSHKRYIVGAGINTRDYKTRVPALIKAGADVLCIDSSEGFSAWQAKTLTWIKKHYGNEVKVGAGNVVDKEGFRFLANLGADFIKVGIGGGSICITRETKGIGRGQATSLIEVAEERNKYFEETGIYIPVCSDGGIAQDYHISLAIAMGADFVMLGRYFARFDESPTQKLTVKGNYMKEYWGEGSARARNWQRYDMGGEKKLSFVEGVDSYVPYAGALKDNVGLTMAKLRSAMCNCGALTISDFQKKARLTRVSPTSIVEGGTHDVLLKDNAGNAIK